MQSVVFRFGQANQFYLLIFFGNRDVWPCTARIILARKNQIPQVDQTIEELSRATGRRFWQDGSAESFAEVVFCLVVLLTSFML